MHLILENAERHCANPRMMPSAPSSPRCLSNPRPAATNTNEHVQKRLYVREASSRLPSQGWWSDVRRPFVICVGREDEPYRIRRATFAYEPTYPVGPFYVKGLSLYGFAMFNATPDEQRVGADDINRWLAEKKLHVAISRTFPLAETAAAHRLLEENRLGKAGTLTGKVIIKVQSVHSTPLPLLAGGAPSTRGPHGASARHGFSY
jgi:hypothetical protein